MNRSAKIAVAGLAGLLGVSGLSQAAGVAPAPNGIALPAGYKDWRVIAPSYRFDKKHVRVILGNDVAVAAARSGKINPWPEGTVLAKVVWKEKPDAAWPSALGAGDFVHAEFMIKDPKKHAATGSWGYARWTGLDQKPYGKDANFAQECVACHTPVKGQDWVFTRPARFP
jgi:hypothetical protein